MANPENIGIAVGIALLSSVGAEIYRFHGCRPPSWIFNFRYHPSFDVRYRYVSHWYGQPRKHRYSCWNRVAIKCGNGINRFAVSTSGLRPPSWIFHFRSFQKVFRRTWLTSRSLNLMKMSHGWYETHVLRSLKFDFLIKIVLFSILKNTHKYKTFSKHFYCKELQDISRLMVFTGSKSVQWFQRYSLLNFGVFPPIYNERL